MHLHCFYSINVFIFVCVSTISSLTWPDISIALDILKIVLRIPVDPSTTPVIELLETDVGFFLTNRLHSNIYVNELNTRKIDALKPVKFIVHGWNEGINFNDWYGRLIKALLRQGDYNVIAVDWSVPATKPYAISAQNTLAVGDRIGNFILKIHEEQDIPLENFHIIGHSLGSHVAGFAGKKVANKTSSKIWQITALDAAGPLFEKPKQPEEQRLSSNDASIVDCIHTDGGVFGFKDALGTIDFFPNGGIPLQPFCLPDAFCSHHRSYEYYIKVLNQGGMLATECESWNIYEQGKCDNNHQEKMAGELTPNSTGNYYLRIEVHNKILL